MQVEGRVDNPALTVYILMPIHNPDNQRLEVCRVYRVAYTVIGQNKIPITTKRDVCVVAMDVADLVDQIRKTCVGVEIAGDAGNVTPFFGVAEDVEIISAQLMGRLHGITDQAFKIITTCDEQERDDM